MSKQFYLPRPEVERGKWLENFATKLPNYATKYGIPSALVTSVQQDSAVFKYFLEYANRITEYSRKINQYKVELSEGADTSLQAPIPPTAPASPFPPVVGIFKRVSSIVNIIKSSLSYLESDGLDLGIEGAEQTALNTVEIKPVISLRLVAGGQPEIVWTKGKTDGLEIYVDRGTGKFELYKVANKPNTIDKTTLPAVGVSQVWKYRAIYRLNDEQIGQWSDTVEISVKGGI